MAKRPDLAATVAQRAGLRPPAAAPEPDAPRTNRQSSRVGKVSITVYFRPEVRRQLRQLAVGADRTLQSLVGEAINDLFAKNGLAEIVEPE